MSRASRAWATIRRSSVLNAHQQTHDIKNLFVMDGAGLPSTGCQNPTLTIMALTVRSCDYLMQEKKKGEYLGSIRIRATHVG